MPRRVIVDENAGPGTAAWEQFQQVFGGERWEYVFLAETHCGIPDVEILDKLMRPGVVLLTGDCVLHTRALERGCRCYTLNLQLDQARTDLFIIPPASLRLMHQLLDSDRTASEPADEAVRRLMLELPKLTLQACLKGPFYNAMQAKLDQLTRKRSNEVTSVDFGRIARGLLASELTESPSLRT